MGLHMITQMAWLFLAKVIQCDGVQFTHVPQCNVCGVAFKLTLSGFRSGGLICWGNYVEHLQTFKDLDCSFASCLGAPSTLRCDDHPTGHLGHGHGEQKNKVL